MIRKSYIDSQGKVVCPMNGANYLTLRGKLANWTSEDIVNVAKENIETIIEPIRADIQEQTYWNSIGSSSNESNSDSDNSSNNNDEGMVLTFKKIGENSKEEYEWESL